MNSKINSYVMVEEGAKIEDSIAKYCVILREAVIENIDRLEKLDRAVR